MLRGSLVAVIAIFADGSAIGAEPSIPAPAVTLDRLVVTGSNLLQSGDGGTSPVTILQPVDLERTGLATGLLEMLAKRLPMFSGNHNLGPTAANANAATTAGGAQIALRNLGTLVLVNGRRVSDNGIGARGSTGRNFVDGSQIPPAAIARVEVLADGASAIYGSDAIGGVVNFILRSDFRGLETGARFAFSTDDGHYTERSAQITGGGGDDRVNLTLTASWSKTDPLFQAERGYSRPILGSSLAVPAAVGQGSAFPTHLLNPALNSPRERNPTGAAATATSLAALVANGTYLPATPTAVGDTLDVAPYVTILLGRESRSAYAHLGAKLLGERLELFGDVLLTKNETRSQLSAASVTSNLTVPAGAPFNPLAVAFPQVSFRFLPAPRTFDHDDRLARGTIGLRGRWGDGWHWEAGHTHSHNATRQRIHNVFYAPNLTRAVAGGYDARGNAVAGGAFSRVVTDFSEERGQFVIQPALDPFARTAGVDPHSLANVLGTVEGTFTATLQQTDATLRGAGFRLPAGRLRFAVGVDTRSEALAGRPDENSRITGPTAGRWLGAPLLDPFARRRRIDSGYGEMRVPFAGEGWSRTGLHALEIDLAWRTENFSDTDRSRAPKYGLRWQPYDGQLTLRATWSESFQAPTQFSLYGPVTQNFTTNGVIPGVFGVNGLALLLTGSNPALRPSRAVSRSFGVAWAPRAFPGLTGGIDFVAVHQTDLAGTLGPAAILQEVDTNGAASPFAGQVAFFNFPGRAGASPVTAPGQLRDWLVTRGNSAAAIFVVDAQRNLSGQRVRALDLHAEYRVPTVGFGTWDFRTTGTMFLSYQFQTTPLEPYFEYAGAATRGGTGSMGSIPGVRLYSVIAWRRASWGVTLGHTYVSPVVDLATGGLTFVNAAAAGVRSRVPVSGFSAFDLAVAYSLKKTAGARGWRRGLGGATVTLGVNNLANRAPPPAPQAFDDNRTDVAAYDPIGRLWYLGVGTKF